MLATSAVLALLFAQAPESDKFRGLRPDALRFIDAAVTASQRPDAGSPQKMKDLAEVLVRQDVSGHVIGPVVPVPKPQPVTPSPAPSPAPKAAEISKKLEQSDPATKQALEAFAKQIRRNPEHPTEALADLMKTTSPGLKKALAPLAPGK